MELHAQTSGVFIVGAAFFAFLAGATMLVGTATGWIFGGVLMVLPVLLVLMSRRGVTIDPAKRLIVHHNGIGTLKLFKRTFPVDSNCEVVLLDYDGAYQQGSYIVYVRDGERRLDLLLTNDGPDADELVTALAEELRLDIVDRHETRGSRGFVLEHHEQLRHPPELGTSER